MKKRYLVLIVVILIDACILLTGFNNAGSDAEYLLEQRTNLFKLLQYGELTQNTAIKRLYEIETGQQLEADIGYVESLSNTEICRVEEMYIKKLERTVSKSGYEVYSAVKKGCMRASDTQWLSKKQVKNVRLPEYLYGNKKINDVYAYF